MELEPHQLPVALGRRLETAPKAFSRLATRRSSLARETYILTQLVLQQALLRPQALAPEMDLPPGTARLVFLHSAQFVVLLLPEIKLRILPARQQLLV